MDVIIPGRIQAAIPGLVSGLRRAQEAAPASRGQLLDKVRGAAPEPDVALRLQTGGIATAGALRPPPPPTEPLRMAVDRIGDLAGRAAVLGQSPGVADDAPRADSLGRLKRALDLLDASARHQIDLMRKGLGDLR
jgi:hypothetical protein